MAYFALVRSIMDYAAPIWDPYVTKHKHDMEAVQRRGARFVKNDYSRYSSVTSMLSKLGWQPLEERRRTARLSLMFKISHNIVEVPASDFLIQADSRTRNSELTYKHFTTHCEQYKNSFFPRTVPEWNKTSTEARRANTVDVFKNRLKRV